MTKIKVFMHPASVSEYDCDRKYPTREHINYAVRRVEWLVWMSEKKSVFGGGK